MDFNLNIRKFRCDGCKHHLFSLNDMGDTVWVEETVNKERLYWQDGDKVIIKCSKCGKLSYPVNGSLRLLKDEQDLIKK